MFESKLIKLWMEFNLAQSTIVTMTLLPSRGGLVVEHWSDNRLDSATVGSNLREVWFINRSEVEISCSYSNSRTPGPERGL